MHMLGLGRASSWCSHDVWDTPSSCMAVEALCTSVLGKAWIVWHHCCCMCGVATAALDINATNINAGLAHNCAGA